jgi:hypothetical protein
MTKEEYDVFIGESEKEEGEEGQREESSDKREANEQSK